MRDWRSLLPFIGTILTGGILVSTFNFFYADFLNQPNIIIQIEDKAENEKREVIQVQNVGFEPAKNLFMQIKADRTYLTLDKIESSENLHDLKNELDDDIVKIFSPRLGYGEGSISKIFLKTNRSDLKETDYIITSTFDQGSSKVLYPPSSPMNEWDLSSRALTSMYEHFPEGYKFFVAGGFKNAIFWGIIFIVGIGLIIYFVNHLLTSLKHKRFVRVIYRQVRSVKLTLDKKPHKLDHFTDNRIDRTIICRQRYVDERKYPQQDILGAESLRRHTKMRHTPPLPHLIPHILNYLINLFRNFRRNILFPSWRQDIWNLWYTRPDEFKMEAINNEEEYDMLEEFFRDLRDRELLVEFNEFKYYHSEVQIISRETKPPDLTQYSPEWVANQSRKFFRDIVKMESELENYIHRIGRIKLEIIFRLLIQLDDDVCKFEKQVIPEMYSNENIKKLEEKISKVQEEIKQLKKEDEKQVIINEKKNELHSLQLHKTEYTIIEHLKNDLNRVWAHKSIDEKLDALKHVSDWISRVTTDKIELAIYKKNKELINDSDEIFKYRKNYCNNEKDTTEKL